MTLHLLCCKNENNPVLSTVNGNQDVLYKTPWMTFAAVLSVSLMNLGFGTAEYWTSPALPHLRKNNKEFKISGDEGSWIASLLSIGIIAGYLLYPLIIDRIGRKYTLLIFAIPHVTSWTLIYLAKNVIFLYFARFIGGLGCGGGYAVHILYIGEISEKKHRAMFVTMAKLVRGLGSTLTLACGAFVSYDQMNLILLSIPLIFVATFIFMPESPYFYLYQNREKEAIESLSKLRGTQESTVLDEDIKRMKDGINQSREHERFAVRMVFQKRRHRRAFLIIMILHAAISFSGARAIGAYAQDILSYSGVPIAPENAALIINSVGVICKLPLIFLINNIGRRMTILWSGITCSASLATVGLFYFSTNYLLVDASTISWLSLIAFCVFKVATFALHSTPSVFCSELFSIQVKSSAVSLLHIIKEFSMFLVKLSFERSVSTFGNYGVFWIYSSACFALSLTGLYIAPETKGKNLEEIQMLLD